MNANDESPPPLQDARMLALPDREPPNTVAARDINGRRKEERVESLSDKWRRWRRSLKARFPYVRRREFEIMSRMPARLIDDIVLRSCASDAVALVALKAPDATLTEEICLFVSHAARPALKRHTALHLEQLLDAGIPVVLILNTALDSADIQIDPALLARLRGVYVRGNRGYDFAAWSHAWKTMQRLPGCTRLYLVNDSVIGPLDTGHFRQMIARIRNSAADVIGLTEAPEPTLHLQSYFLVIQGRALRSQLFTHFFDGILPRRRPHLRSPLHLGHHARWLHRQRHHAPLGRADRRRLSVHQDPDRGRGSRESTHAGTRSGVPAPRGLSRPSEPPPTATPHERPRTLLPAEHRPPDRQMDALLRGL